MSQRQIQKFQVMSLVEAGKMGLKEAAEKIGMSYQQTKRKKGSGLEISLSV